MPNVPGHADYKGDAVEEEIPGSDKKDREPESSERSYYYDDSHGYEDFDPESEEKETDND